MVNFIYLKFVNRFQIKKMLRQSTMSFFIFVFFLFITTTPMQVHAAKYIVQPGDTLSTAVAEPLNEERIWGKHGVLLKLLKLNPQIKDPDRIRPGDEIELGPFTQKYKAGSEIPRAPASTAEANTTAAPEVQKTSESFSEVSLKVSQSYLGIRGKETNGTQGVLGASGAFAYEIAWSPHISPVFWIDFSHRSQKISFDQATTRTLASKDQAVSRDFLGLNYKFSNPFRIELQVGQNDEAFYRAADATTIKVEKVSITYSQIGIRYDFIQTANMTYAVRGAYRVFLPFHTDYFESTQGSGFFGAFAVEQKLGSFTLLGDVFYSQDQFPVKTISFSAAELGLSLGLKFRFGSEQ